jgi:hypothetical protein
LGVWLEIGTAASAPPPVGRVNSFEFGLLDHRIEILFEMRRECAPVSA